MCYNRFMKNLELLAPCGDIQSFYQAIYNGADAVYLGLQNFNARIKADNFTTENIGDIVKFSHLYGVKVYITVNTLISEENLGEFFDMIDLLIKAKVDAFIVQDFGVAYTLLKKYKNIVLHASTQMGIHNLAGAKVLEKLGFKRVVLSRETKPEDIANIKKNTNLEIEYFVHGALCVAFSGNCYLSAMKNKNSGNLGKCYQLCRLKYKVNSNGNKLDGYYLSPSDLCLIERLNELKNLGVDSIKIEGRLKRPSYVAGVVKTYRKALNGGFEKDDLSTLSKIFSRGFNDSAYLNGNDKIINEKVQNHLGEYVGKVVSVKPFKDIFEIAIDTKLQINKNDGLKFILSGKQVSLGVGNAVKKGNLTIVYSARKPFVNSLCYRPLDYEFEQELLSDKRYLPVDFYFTAKENKPISLKAVYGEIEAHSFGDIPPSSINKPLLKEDAFISFSKLKESAFCLNNFYFDADKVFIPSSKLNELRRTVISLLEEKIITAYNKNLPEIVKENYTFNKVNPITKNLLIVNEETDFSFNDETIVLSPLTYSKKVVEDFYYKLKNMGYDKKLYINLPIVATKNEVKFIDDILSSLDFEVGVVAENYWGLKYLSTYPVIIGYNLNVFNSLTANAHLNLGAENIIVSMESDGFDFDYIGIKTGNLPLMTFCHCPSIAVNKKGCKECAFDRLEYTDEKNNSYFIRRYKIINCYFELLSKEESITPKNSKNLIDLRK